MPPSDQILLGSGDPPLAYPTDRVIFLERGAERMVANFGPGDGGAIALQLEGTAEPRRFIEDWIAFARRENARSPLKLHMSRS